MYLHIGLPKTGTTYLQRWFWPDLCRVNSIAYCGKYYTNDDSVPLGLMGSYRMDRLKGSDPNLYLPFSMGGSPTREIVRRLGVDYEKTAHMLRQFASNRRLYSNETLLWRAQDVISVVEHYQAGGARVILTTRDPLAWARSFYLSFLDVGQAGFKLIPTGTTVSEFCDMALRDIHDKIDLFSIALGGRRARQVLDDLSAVLVDGIELCSKPDAQADFCRRLGLDPVAVIGERENVFKNPFGLDVAAVMAEFEEHASRFAGLGYHSGQAT
jgi:hypothetical protein